MLVSGTITSIRSMWDYIIQGDEQQEWLRNEIDTPKGFETVYAPPILNGLPPLTNAELI